MTKWPTKQWSNNIFHVEYIDMEVSCAYEKQFTPNVPGSKSTVTTKNGRRMLEAKCASCSITKTRFLAGDKKRPALTSIKPSVSFRNHKKWWTLTCQNYTEPYNSLEKQLTFDPNTVTDSRNISTANGRHRRCFNAARCGLRRLRQEKNENTLRKKDGKGSCRGPKE